MALSGWMIGELQRRNEDPKI